MGALAIIGCDLAGTALPALERIAARIGDGSCALAVWRAAIGSAEAALLRTCNRVAFIAAGPRLPDDGALHGAVQSVLDCGPAAAITVRRDDAALRHLLRVACSLESAALGEAQILGQVRTAWNSAQALGHAGPHLAGAFDLALRVGRKVRRETRLEQLGIDLPRLALRHLRRELEFAPAAPIALLGTGALADAVLRARPKERRAGWLVVSRDAARATAFAATHGAAGESLDRFLAARRPLRALIAASTATAPLLDARWLAERLASDAGVVDLGLPRNVAEGARAVVRLADLSDLKEQAAANRACLAATVATIEEWIEEALERHARHGAGAIAAVGRVAEFDR